MRRWGGIAGSSESWDDRRIDKKVDVVGEN